VGEIRSMEVELEVDVNADRERVFTALTTGTHVWWGAPYLENKEATDVIMEPKLGGHFYEQWDYLSDEGAGALLGSVVAIKPPELLRMRGSFGMSKRAVVGVVSFELTETSKGTHINFYHHAFGEIDAESEERYTAGWDELLDRLKYFVEEGRAKGVRADLVPD